MIFTVIGIVAALIFIIADWFYLKDTVKGTTKPQRVSWGIAFLLALISFSNQLASGADNSLWQFGVSVIMVGAIFFASLKNGVGGHTKVDIFVIIASLFGIGLWIYFDDPLFSVIITALVWSISISLTYAKTKKNPQSETRITWLLATISALLTAISVGELDYQLLLLPVTSVLLQGYMVYLLYIWPGRKNNRTS